MDILTAALTIAAPSPSVSPGPWPRSSTISPFSPVRRTATVSASGIDAAGVARRSTVITTFLRAIGSLLLRSQR